MNNEDFVKQYYDKGLQVRFFGESINNFSHKELISLIGYLGDEIDNQTKQKLKILDMFRILSK